jgi:hypothetical protein
MFAEPAESVVREKPWPMVAVNSTANYCDGRWWCFAGCIVMLRRLGAAPARIFPAAVMAVLGQVCTCHDHLSLVLSEPGR